MKQEIKTAFWMTIVTTILFGFVYPLIVTGLAHLLFPNRSNGSLIRKNNVVIGSRLIGQAFSSPGYFHSRPSAAGTGYDALNSGGSNLGPTNRQLISRVENDVKTLHSENGSTPIPVDLVTTSGSGLDPDISPEAAEFQIARVARTRGMSEREVRDLVREHTKNRQFGFLGEPRINVLELNLDLDSVHPMH